MATLRNKRKLAAVAIKIQEENPRNGQSRNKSVPRINEEHITQVSEEVEGKITKKLSQEFSRTESRILSALSKLDDFLLNPQIRTHSGTVLETFRNTNVGNQGTNEDDWQSDPHPEAGIFLSQATENSGPEVARDRLEGLIKWTWGCLSWYLVYNLLINLQAQCKRKAQSICKIFIFSAITEKDKHCLFCIILNK